MKPWEDVIPAEDIRAFAGGDELIHRPLSVGVKPALIVVDLTRDFVDDAHPNGWGATGWPAVEQAARLLRGARELGVPVYFTKKYADPGYEPTPAERGRWRRSSTELKVEEGRPPGDVIVDQVAPCAGEVVIHKQSKPSAFFGTPLASLLTADRIDTVVVAGMTTSGCVRATIVDAFSNNLWVLVPHDACADRSQTSHKVSLFDVHMKYADVVSTDETLSYLRGAVH
jgi:maleamate amidohydrolase